MFPIATMQSKRMAAALCAAAFLALVPSGASQAAKMTGMAGARMSMPKPAPSGRVSGKPLVTVTGSPKRMGDPIHTTGTYGTPTCGRKPARGCRGPHH